MTENPGAPQGHNPQAGPPTDGAGPEGGTELPFSHVVRGGSAVSSDYRLPGQDNQPESGTVYRAPAQGFSQPGSPTSYPGSVISQPPTQPGSPNHPGSMIHPGSMVGQPGTFAPYPGPSGMQPGMQSMVGSQLTMAIPPRKKSSAGLIIGLVVGALVLTMVGVGVVVVRAFNDTPKAMVLEYFEAIRAGDAKKALSFATSTPQNQEFLTNEVLARSNEISPITSVEVLGTTRTSARVRVISDGESDTASYEVRKVDGQWKLVAAAFPLDVSIYTTSSDVPLLVNGVKAVDWRKLYLFPGAYEFTTGSPNTAWTESERSFLGGSYSPMMFNRLEVTSEGTNGARAAIAAVFESCLASRVLQPTGCPFRGPTTNPGVVPNLSTIRWTVTPNPSTIWQPNMLQEPTKASGSVLYRVRLQFSYTAANGEKLTYDEDTLISQTFTADLSADPIKVSWNS